MCKTSAFTSGGGWIGQVAQWILYIISQSIAMPLVIGNVLGFDLTEITRFMQHTIFMIGIATLLQVIVGAKLPVIESVTGLWWSLYLILSQELKETGLTAELIQRKVNMALIVSGIVTMLVYLLADTGKLRRLFTSRVTCIYLLLLAIQLSGVFTNGMVGVNALGVSVPSMIISFTVIAVVILIAEMGGNLIKSFGAAIGLIVGWGLFVVFRLSRVEVSFDNVISLPKPLYNGLPVWDTGVVTAGVIVGLVLISNLFATMAASEAVLDIKVASSTIKRSGVVNGFNTILCGLLSTAGTIPVANSLGIIAMTGVPSRILFAIAAAAISVLSCVEPLLSFFSNLPVPVGYAIGFVTFLQVVGIAFKNISSEGMDKKGILVLSFSFMVGTGIMLINPVVWNSVLPTIRPIVSNGVMMGVLVAVGLERLIKLKGE